MTRLGRALSLVLVVVAPALHARAEDTRCTAFAVPATAAFYLDANGNTPYPGIRSHTMLGIPNTKMTWQSERFVRLDTIFKESAAACYPENFLLTSKGRLIQLSVELEPAHWQRFWVTFEGLIPLHYDWPGLWLDQDRLDNLRRMHETFAAYLGAAAGAAPTAGKEKQ